MNKKGQSFFDNIGALGIGIATLTILLVVAFLIMDQGKDVAIDSATDITEDNRTVTITGDAYTVVNGVCTEEETLSITDAWNCSTIEVTNCVEHYTGYNTGNRNISTDGNTVNISHNWGVLNSETSWNISYTCTSKSAAMNATDTLRDATNTIPGWIPLVVIVIIGGILISLVGMFRTRRL